MIKNQLCKILADHALWLKDTSQGVKANLTGADLSRADLTGANLSEANLFKADLTGANLFEANLSIADLTGADLSKANLYGADLTGANLFEANLSKANLYGADLSRADLTGAHLSKANLSKANLYGANLYGADLTGADLTSIINVNIYTFFFAPGHLGYYWRGLVKIGCMIESLEWWLENFQKAGAENGYPDKTIVLYGATLKMISQMVNKGFLA